MLPPVLLHPWLVAVLALGAAEGLEPTYRWPTWPTEVDRIAAPLRAITEHPGQERERVLALSSLEVYAAELLEPIVLAALRDPSPQVRREALRICYERRLEGCVPLVLELWHEGGDPSLRLETLKVLAWDGRPDAVEALLTALRDSNEQVRAEAAAQLGVARLSVDDVEPVRKALLAKLADPAASVRRRVVLALGVMGSGEGSLAIARLLEDPEPAVRAAAAEALGMLGDPTAVPSLRRALDGPNESSVRYATLEAIAKLPGADVVDLLLELLDAPPEGVSATQIAEAIALRPRPEPPLLEGLVDRLAEPVLREPTLHALLIHAPAAEPILRAALDRGLEPSLALEIERLLEAVEPPPVSAAARSERWPALEDVNGWKRQLEQGAWSARFEAAAVLAERTPRWLPAVLDQHLAPLPHPEPVRAWLATTAGLTAPIELSAMSRARLLGWAHDEGLGASDRCLALLALTSVRTPTLERPSGWRWLFEEPSPDVRACALLAAGRLGALDLETRALGLLDVSPQVRSAALMAMIGQRWSDALGDHVTMLARMDPYASVRRLAQDVARAKNGGRWTLIAAPRAEISRKRRERSATAWQSRLPNWVVGDVCWSVTPVALLRAPE